MKNILLFVLSLSVWLPLQAQGILSFEKETHDFGTLEEGNIATYEFSFTNTGDQAIEIERVKASCGCTTPFYTKEIIFPGSTGKIKISYNTNSRPGPFTKSVTVMSNAKKNTQILYIKGFVNPREKQGNVGANYQTETPEKTPPSFNIDLNEFDFGTVEVGKVVKQRFNLLNSGQQNLIITSLENDCKCISFGLSRPVIGQNQTAILEITLTADQIRELDEYFVINTNDPENPSRSIHLKAKVQENFGNRMFRPEKKPATFE